MRTLRTLPRRRPTRRGTTLTEVLMAILCMGIGVVAVASLFPIALLRSVQATQLTNSTILRFNAETLIDLNPSLVFDPDDDNDTDEHFNTNYLVDPLGSAVIASDTGAAAPAVGSKLPRFNAGVTGVGNAEYLVTLPDSWVTVYDDAPSANTLTSIDLQANIPQDVIDTFDALDADNDNSLSTSETGGDVLRVVMFHINGNVSETRYIRDSSQMSGTQITWPGQAALPASYGGGNVSRVRIETRERRYTWLLTVRNFTNDAAIPQALVDVVIFFRRSPSLAEETTFTLNNQDAMGNQNLPSGQYRVTGTNPGLKKGGFLLNTDTGVWHRIQKVVDGSPPVITLERNPPGLNGHEVVFMRGVVEVYSLGTKP